MQRQKQTLFAIVALDLLGFGMVIPQLGPYAHALGAPEWLVGVLFATYSAMQFLFAPVWGSLSDRIGRRPILLVSLAGSVIGYTLFALANSVAMLFASRLVAGIAAANIAVAQAYLADITPPNERAGAMGLIGAAFGLGFVLGPPLGGMLGYWGGVHAIGLGAATLSSLALMSAWVLLPEPMRHNAASPTLSRWQAFQQIQRNRALLLCVVLFFFATFAVANLQFSLPLFLPLRWHWTTEQAGLRVGWLLGFSGFLMGALQAGAVGRWAKRFGEPRLIVAGTGLTVVGLALLPLVPYWVWLFPCLAVLSIGGAMAQPSLASLVSQLSPEDLQGSVLGVYQSAGSFARILGPLWAGFWFHLAPTLPFWTAAAVMAMVWAISRQLPQLPTVRTHAKAP
ncbi:Tetracycline resistance protein, class C [bacterium HR17]|jgi:multidrug resistance protein|uniref:Tetracycline resistance protein, class C n=1 Tax=Candidatus Fervidibacter japonicus TaxID=2035412 RepID=A0A2H5X9C2_9BACT|nr:Tetracycline resistance protein, class C [bacterium HR17]